VGFTGGAATLDIRPRTAPFVGRVRELRLLDEMLACPKSHSAVITGEPGIGRTALLEQVAGAPGQVLWVRGATAEAPPSYTGVADLLLPLREHLDKLPPVQRDALAATLALCQGPPPSPLAICVGALGVLTSAAESDPLLILVDDFQWLDSESRQVLAFVARRLAEGPAAMVIAVRDGPGAPAEPLGLPTLRLAGLQARDCRALVTGLGHDVSPAVLAEIVEETGGNPLAVLHAVTGGIGEASEHPLTRAWGDVVDDLPESARTALCVLAAAGRPTRPAVVEAVLAAVDCSLTDLAAAESAGLVVTAPGLRLRHPLLRPAVLHRTPLRTRMAVSRALAEHASHVAPATNDPDDDILDVLATASAEVRMHGDRGESARLRHRPAPITVDPARGARRRLAAATDAQPSGENGRAVAWSHERPTSGGDDMVAMALCGVSSEPAEGGSLPAIAVAALARAVNGDSSAARQHLALSEPLIAQGVPAGDLPFVTALSAAHLLLEELENARRLIGLVVDLARGSGATAAATSALVVRAELEHRSGNWAAACTDASEALGRAEERHDVMTLTAALVTLARIDAARGDVARCRQRLDRARRHATEHGVEFLGLEISALHGIAALGVGDNEAATAHLEAARAAAGPGQLLGPTVVSFCGDLVEALARAGHRVRATEALAWLDDVASRTGLMHPAAAAARCRGLLSPDLDHAEPCFAAAAALHERVQMPFQRARTLLCEGETLRRLRHPAAARSPLRAAGELFDRLGARAWVLRTESELTATGGRQTTGNGTGGFDRLTPQEREIARAVCQGMSNAEAAASLFVSRKTVEAHLTQVYRKLGLRSRTELASEYARSER
jgi:DNA-binding CsgD family transcriptional regulator